MAIIRERPRAVLYIENSVKYGHLTLLHCHFANSIIIVLEIHLLQIQDLVESCRKAWEESKILRVQGNRLKVNNFFSIYELYLTHIIGNGKLDHAHF